MQNKKYEITLEQEVLSEVCEGILAEYFRTLKSKNKSTKDVKDPLVAMYINMSRIKEDIVGNKYTTLEELKKVEGYFIYVKKFLEEIEE